MIRSRKALLTSKVGIPIVVVILIVSILPIVSGYISPTFANSWTLAAGDPPPGSVNLPVAQSIAVSVSTNQTVVVIADGFDCDASASINYTIADSGGNSYAWRGQRNTANCGTVDRQIHAWTSVNVTATTSITVTQTGGTGLQVGFAAIVLAYNNVGFVGTVNVTSLPSSNFPELVVTKIFPATSFAVAVAHFDQGPTMPPTYNNGVHRNHVTNPSTVFRNLAGDNNATDGASSGGGRVCASTEICIFPNLSIASPGWGVTIELAPYTRPTVVTLPATGIDFDRATLNGNVTDFGNTTAVTAFFDWGDTILLGNKTDNFTLRPPAPQLYSLTLYSLAVNHTYYFRAHVEESANPSNNHTGAILNFTTVDPLKTLNFIFLPILFFILMMTMLVGAWQIRKKRGIG